MNAVAAILLAAGRSQRMGAFKPLLPFGDTSVIRTCISALRSAGIETIVVVVGHHADEIQDHLRDADVEFALNPDPNSEMSASIAIGVAALPHNTNAVLIALSDHPAVGSEVIGAIVSQWQAGKTLVVPEFKGRGGHPVLIDMSFRTALQRLDTQRGLKGFFAVHREEVQRLPVDSAYIARDLDTWDDYLTLHQEVFGRPPTLEPTAGSEDEPKCQPN